MTAALRTRLAIPEKGRQTDLPLLVSEGCPDLARLVAEAERQGRAVLILSPLDERL